MVSKTNVYVPHDAGHDYTGLEKYGEIVMITSGPIDRYNVPRLMQTFRQRMAAAQETDFIVCNGLPVAVAIASAIMAARWGKVNYLQWQKRGYFTSTVLLGDLHPFYNNEQFAPSLEDALRVLHQSDEFAERFPNAYDEIDSAFEALRPRLGTTKLG